MLLVISLCSLNNSTNLGFQIEEVQSTQICSRVAGNEIRLADLSHSQAYFTLLKQLVLKQSKLMANWVSCQTVVLKSEIVQQKDHFPAKCFIFASVKLKGKYNVDKYPLTDSSVHRCTNGKMSCYFKSSSVGKIHLEKS